MIDRFRHSRENDLFCSIHLILLGMRIGGPSRAWLLDLEREEEGGATCLGSAHSASPGLRAELVSLSPSFHPVCRSIRWFLALPLP